jgi:hypothetical protein
MQVRDIKTALVVFNEGVFLSEEMVKFFADNPGVDIIRLSLHIEYQTGKNLIRVQRIKQFKFSIQK